MKKILVWVLILALCLSMAACTADAPAPAEPQDPPVSADTPDTPEAPADEPDETPAEPETPEEKPAQSGRPEKYEPTIQAPEAIEVVTMAADDLSAAVEARPLAEVPPQQADDRPVIFIADGGTGDGSSPDSPLAWQDSKNCFENVTSNESTPLRHYNSLLYQAFAKLYGSGGTVVICGEVVCDKTGAKGLATEDALDLALPHLGGADVTITSVWDGVDYRQTNGARLVIQAPVCLSTHNPVTFRDLDICTQGDGMRNGAGRIIAGCGFPLVVDTGVNCIPLDEAGNVIASPSVDLYPNIVGGQRFVSNENPTDLTLRSGTFYTVCAGAYGVDITTYGEVYASTKLTIEDGVTVYGNVSGTTREARGVQTGDVTIDIRGGSFSGKIMLCSAAGMATPNAKGILRISGGEFADGVKILARGGNTYKHDLAVTAVDLSAYPGDRAALAAKLVGFNTPAVDYDLYESVALLDLPYRGSYAAGDLYDPTGLALAVSFNGKDWQLPYAYAPGYFTFQDQSGNAIEPKADRLTEEVTEVHIFYDGVELGVQKLDVQPRPAVEILGAAVSTASERQTLGFIVGLEEGAADLTVSDYGVVAVPADWVEDPADLICGTVAVGERLECYPFAWESADSLYTTYQGSANAVSYAAVKDIPVEEYDQAYLALAYYTFYQDGKLHTVWSQPYTTSVYAVAVNALDANAPEADVVAENVIEKVLTGAVSTYDQTLVDEKVETMVAYMEAMGTTQWICPEDINFAGSVSWSGALQYKAGETYSGMPYLAGFNGLDNLENFLRFVDEDGLYVGPTDWDTMSGNNCTSAVFQAFNRISNAYDYWDRNSDPSLNVIPKAANEGAPFVVVGDYYVAHTSALTTQILLDNGSSAAEREQIYYGAMAQARRGDFVTAHWNNDQLAPLSHIRMVTDVHVVYNADGTVNGEQSYALLHEQTSTMVHEIRSSWGIDRKFTFRDLYQGAYIPVRAAAFETGYFATPYCLVYDANTADNIHNGVCGYVRSNYNISEVTLQITDLETGEVVLHESAYTYFSKHVDVAQLDPNNIVKDLSGGYEYLLTVDVGNVEREYIRFVF